MSHKKSVIVFFAISLLFESQVQLLAQENSRRQEEEKRKYLQKTEEQIIEHEGRIYFDFGGWINHRYDDYKDDDNDSSQKDSYDYTNSVDVRLWFKAVLTAPAEADRENKHSFYVRIKDLYLNRRPEDTAGGSDHDGPHLDYAFLTLDFRPAWIVTGRYYFNIGEGIAYSDVHDGVDLFLFPENWNLKAFLSYSQPNEYNIDTSIPGYEDNSDRVFTGLELTYRGISAQEIYGYLLIQRDNSNEQPEDLTNEYDYNCEYMGLGARGTVTSRFHYQSELIHETGKSRIYDSNLKSNINAWAGDFKLSYNSQTYTELNLYAEYAFGSGDSDRTNVTDTQNGNASGEDNNFLYFGYIDTGYALSPRLSNLHFFKFGFSFKPLKRYAVFKKAELKWDYFKFYKDKKSGGIYDLDTSREHRDIGDEIDAAFIWHIFSDLNVIMQYGHFMPGKAYAEPANDSEEYFSFSTNVIF